MKEVIAYLSLIGIVIGGVCVCNMLEHQDVSSVNFATIHYTLVALYSLITGTVLMLAIPTHKSVGWVGVILLSLITATAVFCLVMVYEQATEKFFGI